MINKNKIHDIDLVAVIQHNGHNYEINTDGSFRICISDEEFKKTLLVFNNNYRPVFKRIKRLRKDLQNRIKRANVP